LTIWYRTASGSAFARPLVFAGMFCRVILASKSHGGYVPPCMSCDETKWTVGCIVLSVGLLAC